MLKSNMGDEALALRMGKLKVTPCARVDYDIYVW